MSRATRRIQSMVKPIHELRGALGTLELGLTTIERGSSRSDIDTYLEALRGPLERARLAVEDLDSCRLGHPAMGMNDVERIELGSLVHRSARAWSRLASFYNSRLQVDWRAGSASVHADERRLKQVFDNLIANALEHGGGRVLVEGRIDSDRVCVSISDGGPGPPRQSRGRLERAVSSPRGHGLSIAREVVHAHGGKLVPGSGGHGPAIVIELPLVRSLRAGPRGESPQSLSSETLRAASGSHAPNAA